VKNTTAADWNYWRIVLFALMQQADGQRIHVHLTDVQDDRVVVLLALASLGL
jgi:hypothetical protein